MKLFFQRVDIGFGSVGGLHGLQFGVEIFINRRVGENALLRLQFGLKDSLASLTRWLPIPVTTHFAKLVDWPLEKEKLTILERSSSELDDELELESEVELSELDELGLDMLTALELKKIWRRK